MTPLSIRLHEEKEKRLSFISRQENKRCRHENCSNWAAGERFVGTISMHHDLISDELGLCWKHVQEQRTRRKETRKIHPDGKVSPLRDDGSALTNLMSSSTSSSSSYNDSRKRLTYREKMLHFTQNYSSSDFSTSAGLGMMLHSAIILKDSEDIFTFFLAKQVCMCILM